MYDLTGDLFLRGLLASFMEISDARRDERFERCDTLDSLSSPKGAAWTDDGILPVTGPLTLERETDV